MSYPSVREILHNLSISIHYGLKHKDEQFQTYRGLVVTLCSLTAFFQLGHTIYELAISSSSTTLRTASMDLIFCCALFVSNFFALLKFTCTAASMLVLIAYLYATLHFVVFTSDNLDPISPALGPFFILQLTFPATFRFGAVGVFWLGTIVAFAFTNQLTATAASVFTVLAAMLFISAMHQLLLDKHALQSKEQYALLLNGCYEGLVLLQGENVVDASESFASMVGLPRENLIGKTVWGLTAANSRAALMSAVGQRYYATEPGSQRVILVDSTLLTPDGPMPVEVGITHGQSSLSEEGVVVCEFRDISHRKRIEEALLEAKEGELVQAINRSEEMKRKASDQAALVASITHEIRNPLATIVGMAGLLMAKGTNLRQQHVDAVRIIHDSAGNLRTLMDDILQLEKLEADKVEMECIAFDVATVASSCARTMAGEAAKKGVEIAVDVDPNVPLIATGDPHRLTQILVNLVSNAVKFTSNGGWVNLTVRKQAADGNEMVLRFSVEDTGIGIKEDAVHRIFQPFLQADKSISRHYGGTGLGLSISRKLAQRMGGDIEVKSQYGKGSLFSLHIKVNVPREYDCPQCIPFLCPFRVLLAWRPGIGCEALMKIMRSWGCTVVLRHDIESVIAVLTTTSDFAVIVMDSEFEVEFWERKLSLQRRPLCLVAGAKALSSQDLKSLPTPVNWEVRRFAKPIDHNELRCNIQYSRRCTSVIPKIPVKRESPVLDGSISTKSTSFALPPLTGSGPAPISSPLPDSSESRLTPLPLPALLETSHRTLVNNEESMQTFVATDNSLQDTCPTIQGLGSADARSSKSSNNVSEGSDGPASGTSAPANVAVLSGSTGPVKDEEPRAGKGFIMLNKKKKPRQPEQVQVPSRNWAAENKKKIIVAESEDSNRSRAASALRTLGWEVLPAETGDSALQLWEDNSAALVAMVVAAGLKLTSGIAVIANIRELEMTRGLEKVPIVCFVDEVSHESLERRALSAGATEVMKYINSRIDKCMVQAMGKLQDSTLTDSSHEEEGSSEEDHSSRSHFGKRSTCAGRSGGSGGSGGSSGVAPASLGAASSSHGGGGSVTERLE